MQTCFVLLALKHLAGWSFFNSSRYLSKLISCRFFLKTFLSLVQPVVFWPNPVSSLLDPLGVDIATSVCAHASSSSGSSSSSPGTNSSSAEAEGRSGRAVLNIGFVMGIVDNALQRRKPGRHVIVEAHPAVH